MKVRCHKIFLFLGEHGYIGMSNNKILCNRGQHDAMMVQQVESGYYQLRTSTGIFYVLLHLFLIFFLYFSIFLPRALIQALPTALGLIFPGIALPSS